jgi:hypothetical protein
LRGALVHTVAMPIPGANGTLAELLPVEFVLQASQAIEARANWQLYPYAVLRHFGFEVPPLRSRALWSDARLPTVTEVEQPLHLVLNNATWDSYGAHVAVMVATLLHLCREIGRPFAQIAAP